jgi:Domain of unknown function (DUF4386)
MTAPQRLARTAGVYYLVVAIFGGFAHAVRTQVYVPGDAATTADNVVAHADLVRVSFAADLVQATFAVFLVLALYRLLKHVQPAMARAMVVFVVLQVGITCLNLVHQFGALMVATQPSYSDAFDEGGTDALVLLLMELQHNGYLVAQIFFGLWLFPLGLLAYRSGMFPRALGVILMVATGAYLVDTVLQFLAKDLADAVSGPVLIPVVIVAEVWMMGYLLIKGCRTPAADGFASNSKQSADRSPVSASS